jgi:hypothetical protein
VRLSVLIELAMAIASFSACGRTRLGHG